MRQTKTLTATSSPATTVAVATMVAAGAVALSVAGGMMAVAAGFSVSTQPRVGQATFGTAGVPRSRFAGLKVASGYDPRDSQAFEPWVLDGGKEILLADYLRAHSGVTLLELPLTTESGGSSVTPAASPSPSQSLAPEGSANPPPTARPLPTPSATATPSPARTPFCYATGARIRGTAELDQDLGPYPLRLGGGKRLGPIAWPPGETMPGISAYRFEAQGNFVIDGVPNEYTPRKDLVAEFCSRQCDWKQWVQRSEYSQYLDAEGQVVSEQISDISTAATSDGRDTLLPRDQNGRPRPKTAPFGGNVYLSDNYAKVNICPNETIPFGQGGGVMEQIREEPINRLPSQAPLVHWADGPGHYDIAEQFTIADQGQGYASRVVTAKIFLKQEFSPTKPECKIVCRFGVKSELTYRAFPGGGVLTFVLTNVRASLIDQVGNDAPNILKNACHEECQF